MATQGDDSQHASSSDLASTDEEGVGGNQAYTISDLLDELDSEGHSSQYSDKENESSKAKISDINHNQSNQADESHKESSNGTTPPTGHFIKDDHIYTLPRTDEKSLHNLKCVRQGRSSGYTEVQKRISSDIGGRFFVEGSEYMESDEYLSHKSSSERETDDELDRKEVHKPSKSVSFGSDDEVIVYDTNKENDYLEILPEDVEAFMEGTGQGSRSNPDLDRPLSYDPNEKAMFVKVFPDVNNSELMEKILSKSDAGERTANSTLSGSGYPETQGVAERRESVYEPYNAAPDSYLAEDDDDDGSWGSSEFESFDEDEEQGGGRQGTVKRTRSKESVQSPTWDVKVTTKNSSEGNSQGIPAVWDTFKAKLGQKPRKEEEEDENSTCVEVTLNMDKHPPPELGPAPSGLDNLQMKRRHIVASIVDSERSYMDSLKRLVEDYEKPLIQSKTPVIPKSAVKCVFYKVRDILQCHNMFHIELSEHVRVWDKNESIGNVFTASFSKSIVFDVYSAFVNNFSEAMDTAKKQARQKQAFAEFLKQRIESATDRLSLFGLMVKPVQRFPQFIMLLQDLLKSTPKTHHDRLALQMALTELETLTHRLNETKRESEYRHDACKILNQLTGRYSIKTSDKRYLIRQDDMIQLEYNGEENKTKNRRIFMMSDQIICVSVVSRDHDHGTEKYRYKWSVPLRDVEIIENEVSSNYNVRGGPGKTSIVAPKLDKSTFTPWKKELDDMLHDLPIMEQIGQLVTQFRLPYENLHPEIFFNLTRYLQLEIQRHSDLDRSIIQLSVPAKHILTSKEKLKEEMNKVKNIKQSTQKKGRSRERRSKGHARIMVTLQAASPTIKQEWLLELKNAKLALVPDNNPSWCVPETEAHFQYKVPLFIKPLLIDITRQNNVIESAIPVLLPTSDPCVAIQHLWVCSSDTDRGQVTVVSIHTSQPHVVESFIACESAILCSEMVPGFATCADEYAFSQDTVWMATQNNEMVILPVVEETRGDPLLVVPLDNRAVCMKYLDSRLYVGLENGHLAIYTRDQDGIWNPSERDLVELGTQPVQCLLPLNHEMWAACGGSAFCLTATTRYREGGVQTDIQKKCHELSTNGDCIACLVKAGVGLMVSYVGKSVIQIYCLETMLYLQDINIDSAIRKVLKDKPKSDFLSNISITVMLASKGLLWIGTSVGCVLTLPLPRLEGVPQIKGRPSVSFHGHVGPIKFLAPIQCGVTQVRHYGDASSIVGGDGMSWVDTISVRSRDDVASGGLAIEGATEGETDDFRGFTHSDDITQMLGPGRPFFDDMMSYNGDEHSFGMNGMGLYAKTKWMSTPDLRQRSVFDDQDDLSDLYKNLMEGNDFEEIDSEILEPKKKRRSYVGNPRLAMPSSPSADSSKVKSPKAKYATLPVVMEDCPVYESFDKQPQTQSLPQPVTEEANDGLSNSTDTTPTSSHLPDQSSSSNPETISTTSQESPNSAQNAPDSSSHSSSSPSHHAPHAPTLASLSPSHSAMSSSCHVLNKAVIIVSGGDGHINWSDPQAFDKKYEDICLLLWQCRV